MDLSTLSLYCGAKKGARADLPFGPVPICWKVGGRIFAEIYPKDGDRKVTLRCHPALALALRQRYPGAVVAGYHCPARQKPYKNTVGLGLGVPDEELFRMIDHSYDEALKSLKRAEQEALMAL